MNETHLLRDKLETLAAGVTQVDLYDRVLTGARRAARRRHVVTSGGVVLLVAILIR
jgi:hypothetical protein